MLCFQLNPSTPNLVACGLMTGQVLFFEFAENALTAASAAAALGAGSGAGGGAGSGDMTASPKPSKVRSGNKSPNHKQMEDGTSRSFVCCLLH